MTSFKILGMADEGKCECCGANCPKRRVAVRPVDADGCEHDVQFWGVICASKVRTGSKAVRFQNQIVAEAQRADADREYFTRQKMARIITALPHIHNLGFGNARISNNAKDAANQMYRMTGRNIMGSCFAENAAGHIVRVDGTDAKDVQFYADLGFTQTTAAVAA